MTNKYKKLLNILSYKGDENQNCTENPFHPSEWLSSRKITNAGEDVEKRILYTLLVGM